MDSDYIDPGLLAQQMHAREPTSIQIQLDTSKELEDLKYDLLGFTYDEAKDIYIQDNRKQPQINEQGVNAVLAYVKPRINKIFSLSNHDEEDINNRCLAFVNGITIFLGRHFNDFEIISLAAMDNMIDLFDDMYHATIIKSIKGWEGDSIRKGHTTVESRQAVYDGREKRMSVPNMWG